MVDWAMFPYTLSRGAGHAVHAGAAPMFNMHIRSWL